MTGLVVDALLWLSPASGGLAPGRLSPGGLAPVHSWAEVSRLYFGECNSYGADVP